MILLAVLLFLAAIFAGVSFLVSVMHYFIEGHWPIWHFRLFFAWWWPFRKPSAATMLADTMICELYKDWRASGYKDWVNSKLNAKFSTFCDSIKAEMNGQKIPLSQWDKYRIVDAVKRFERGAVGQARDDGARMAAEAIIKAYGEKA